MSIDQIMAICPSSLESMMGNPGAASAQTQVTEQVPAVGPSVAPVVPIAPVQPAIRAPQPTIPIAQPSQYPPGLAELASSKNKPIQEVYAMYLETKAQYPEVKSFDGLKVIMQSKLSTRAPRGTPVDVEGRIITISGPKVYKRTNQRTGEIEESVRADIDWILYYNNQYIKATMTFYKETIDVFTAKDPEGRMILQQGRAYKMNANLELRKGKDDETGEEVNQYILYPNVSTKFERVAKLDEKHPTLLPIVDFFRQADGGKLIKKLSDWQRFNNETQCFIGFVGEIWKNRDGNFIGINFNDGSLEDTAKVYLNDPLLTMLSKPDSPTGAQPIEGIKVMVFLRIYIRPQDGTPSFTCVGIYPIKEEQ